MTRAAIAAVCSTDQSSSQMPPTQPAQVQCPAGYVLAKACPTLMCINDGTGHCTGGGACTWQCTPLTQMPPPAGSSTGTSCDHFTAVSNPNSTDPCTYYVPPSTSSTGTSTVISRNVNGGSQGTGFNASLTDNPLEVNYIYTGGVTYFGGLHVDFGDGQSGTMGPAPCIGGGGPCQVPAVAHTFASAGTYTATLTGIGEGNSTVIASLTITVGIPSDVIKRAGEQEGSFLIQTINSTSVDGLWYNQYPVATNQGTPKTLHIGDDIGYACAGVSEKLRVIDSGNQTVTFTKVTGAKPMGGCPI